MQFISVIRWLAMALLVTGCGTMHSARPLQQGEHQFSANLGGPMVEFGGAYIPLPNIIVQGKSGLPSVLDRPMDIDYGTNLTGYAFGIMGVHAGVNWQLVEQNKGIPALTLSNRLWLQSNVFDFSKPFSRRSVWAVDQIELTLSYKFGEHLLYFGAAEYLDFRNPDLIFTPFIGSDLRLSNRVGLQLEMRYFAINKVQPVDAVTWLNPGTGAIGIILGVRYDFKGKTQ